MTTALPVGVLVALAVALSLSRGSGVAQGRAARLAARQPSPHPRGHPLTSGATHWSMTGRGAVVGVAAVGLVTILDGTELAVGAVGAGVALGLASGWRRGRAAKRRRERSVRVIEVSEALVGELRAGTPVTSALRRGVEVWPDLGPVAAAAALGADVPAAMRRVAQQTDTPVLADVASAWQVSLRTGCSLVRALDQVSATARAELAATRVVAAELASAQATARLVAGLPVATLAMASGAGGDPWRFLFHHPVGVACLAAGSGLVLTGLWWIDRIAARVGRR